MTGIAMAFMAMVSARDTLCLRELASEVIICS